MLSPAKVQTQDVTSNDLETGRALFSAGDYEAVLEVTAAALPRARDARERVAIYVLRSAAFGEVKEYHQALQTLGSIGSMFDQASPMTKARFFGQRAYLNIKLGNADDPLVDYAGARDWAQVSGDRLTEATARNNMARQYGKAGRYSEAMAESDAAIKIASHLENDPMLGRFYDQRAQILLEKGNLTESLVYSDKAIGLLQDHPSLIEARETRGRTLISLLQEHVDRDDLIEAFRLRRYVVGQIPDLLDKETAQVSMERANGHVSNAAKLLGVTPCVLLKAIRRYGLQNLQRHKIKRSIITKK